MWGGAIDRLILCCRLLFVTVAGSLFDLHPAAGSWRVWSGGRVFLIDDTGAAVSGDVVVFNVVDCGSIGPEQLCFNAVVLLRLRSEKAFTSGS